MKKSLILPPIICALAIGLTGCGHEHVWTDATCLTPKTCTECGETEGDVIDHKWTDATCEKAKYCDVCGETDGKPLNHEWMEATYENPKTCSLCGLTEGEPLPTPYCVENNITFEDLQDMDLAFAAGFSQDGELVEIDGLWADAGMAHYAFGEVTTEPSEKEDYINVIIPYEITLSTEVHLDDTKFTGNFRLEASWASFRIGDNYTGLIVPSNLTYGSQTQEYSRDFEWDGNVYTISYIKETNSEGNFSGWYDEGGSIHGNTYSVISNNTLTITIPEEYDGTVLCIERNGKKEVILNMEENNGYFLDEHGADYYT